MTIIAFFIIQTMHAQNERNKKIQDNERKLNSIFKLLKKKILLQSSG